MQKKDNKQLQKSTLNGAFHKDNYIWGGAMNIAWNTLSKDIIKEPLKLKTQSALAEKMVQNFNASTFSTKDLSDDSYYTKAGYGQATLDAINKECREKFPKKTFADIEMKLHPKDIISYAYFVKEVQYLNPFIIKPYFYFENTAVKGFKANQKVHFDNIRVGKYFSDQKFLIKLLLKQKDEELFIVKGFQQALPQEILSVVQQHSNQEGRLQRGEEFQMPMIQLDVKRDYTELVGCPSLNQGFKDYVIGVMFENIKFKMDEVGAKVENEAVMMLERCAMINPKPKRNFIVNSPFWVVMKQKGCRPYFLLQVNNTEFMAPLH